MARQPNSADRPGAAQLTIQTGRLQALALGLIAGLALTVVNWCLGHNVSNVGPVFLLPMLVGGLFASFWAHFREATFDAETPRTHLARLADRFLFGAVAAVGWWVGPLFLYGFIHFGLGFATMLLGGTILMITDPILPAGAFGSINYLAGAMSGLLCLPPLALFGLGVSRELLGRQPWSNKRLVRNVCLAAALFGISYGLWFAATWTPFGVG